MPIRDTKELFIQMLSNVRQGAEQSTKLYSEMSQLAERSDVKEALEARAFVSNKVLGTLDECFRVLGEHPRESKGRIHDIFAEDFRKEFSEIESPAAKLLFILSKAHHLNQLRVGEYIVMIEAANITDHPGVGVLLASCLADKLAFAERTRHMIREIAEERMERRRAA